MHAIGTPSQRHIDLSLSRAELSRIFGASMVIDGSCRKGNVVGHEAHEADKERVDYLRVPCKFPIHRRVRTPGVRLAGDSSDERSVSIFRYARESHVVEVIHFILSLTPPAGLPPLFSSSSPHLPAFSCAPLQFRYTDISSTLQSCSNTRSARADRVISHMFNRSW